MSAPTRTGMIAHAAADQAEANMLGTFKNLVALLAPKQASQVMDYMRNGFTAGDQRVVESAIPAPAQRRGAVAFTQLLGMYGISDLTSKVGDQFLATLVALASSRIKWKGKKGPIPPALLEVLKRTDAILLGAPKSDAEYQKMWKNAIEGVSAGAGGAAMLYMLGRTAVSLRATNFLGALSSAYYAYQTSLGLRSAASIATFRWGAAEILTAMGLRGGGFWAGARAFGMWGLAIFGTYELISWLTRDDDDLSTLRSMAQSGRRSTTNNRR